MCSDFLAENTRRAAALKTDCSRCNSCPEMPVACAVHLGFNVHSIPHKTTRSSIFSCQAAKQGVSKTQHAIIAHVYAAYINDKDKLATATSI